MASEKNDIIVRLRKKASELPLTPGVYLMKDKAGKIIYVGKSKAMKNRVSSYFVDLKNHSAKTLAMLSFVNDFDYILTDTNIEALALENKLIKLHSPRFNIKLKDGKNYPYLKITLSKEFPVLSFTRKRTSDGARYFGPYSGTSIALSLMKTAKKTFGLHSCSRVFPRDIGKERPCLYKQLGQCAAPCDGSVSSEEYKNLNRKAAAFLRGEFGAVKKELTARMEKAAEELNFETAAVIRDRIAALDACHEKQTAVGAEGEEKDVIALYSDQLGSALSVFFVRDGYISDKMTDFFPPSQLADQSSIVAYLCDFYLKREYIPEKITFDFPLDTEPCEDLKEFLEKECKARVKLIFPQIGEAKKLCAVARQNAKEYAEKQRTFSEKSNEISLKLASLLGLEVVPQKIEAFDISNFGSDNITAGKIAVVDGKFSKKDYRIYKIKSTEIQDDYASMREAVSRRLKHTEDVFPDLILLDGGKNHVSVVKEVLQNEGWSVPVFGMVKDSYHKTRALTTEDAEISIAKDTSLFNFIYGIQEEIHRFTVSRMHSAKRKTLKKSVLTDIPGIGSEKAKILLTHFKGAAKIKNASYDELLAVKGLNRKDASNIYGFFHNDANEDLENHPANDSENNS